MVSKVKRGIEIDRQGKVTETYTAMDVPKYVIDLIENSTYNIDNKCENYAAGYTINIRKKTARTMINTHIAEVEKLKKWVERQGGECLIINKPTETRYCEQYVTVTIYDPVMKYLEAYIGAEIDRRKKARAAISASL